MDDAAEILRIQNIYALGVDTRQWDLFDLVFTPDVEIICPPGLHWTDLASFKRGFDIIHAPLDASMHCIVNHICKVDGDRAFASHYSRIRLIRRCETGGRDYWETGDWKEDELVRTAGGWRVKKREFRVCWWDGNPLAVPPMPPDTPGWQAGFEQDAGSPEQRSLVARAGSGRMPLLNALLGRTAG